LLDEAANAEKTPNAKISVTSFPSNTLAGKL